MKVMTFGKPGSPRFKKVILLDKDEVFLFKVSDPEEWDYVPLKPVDDSGDPQPIIVEDK